MDRSEPVSNNTMEAFSELPAYKGPGADREEYEGHHQSANFSQPVNNNAMEAFSELPAYKGPGANEEECEGHHQSADFSQHTNTSRPKQRSCLSFLTWFRKPRRTSFDTEETEKSYTDFEPYTDKPPSHQFNNAPTAVLTQNLCKHKTATKCQLDHKLCCACLDRRPAAETYEQYVDGLGWIDGATRWQYYCANCKASHQALASALSCPPYSQKPSSQDVRNYIPAQARRQSTCKHKTSTNCQLYHGLCCACLDKRPKAKAYEHYVDGEGWVMGATRWQYYCAKCKETYQNPAKSYLQA